MLDKFRCDEIVHFNGGRHDQEPRDDDGICSRSLEDSIKKRPEPSERVKAKVMLDSAKGLAYLHSNGILHRDINSDILLVFSLDKVLAVVEKLTSFWSSRNINLLMTNMTFTRALGR